MQQFLISFGIIAICLAWSLFLIAAFVLLINTFGWGTVLLGVAAVAIAGTIAICANEYRLYHRREANQ